MNRDISVIYVLWLRAMKRFIRSPSQIIGSIAMPVLFLLFLDAGFGSLATFLHLPPGVSYIDFLVPGIVGMSMLFAATTSGISLLWDKQFGFLKEVMVVPVRRVSIVLGRVLGGLSTAIIQSTLLIIISLFIGFKIPSILGILITYGFMVLIGIVFISLGLIIASFMKDMQGFGLILNLLIFPLFFLSGAIYPITVLPTVVKYITYINPLTYGVDGMRAALIGISVFPGYVDALVLGIIAVVMLALGAIAFAKGRIV